MFQDITIEGLASIITALTVIFGVPFAFSKYLNKMKEALSELKRESEEKDKKILEELENTRKILEKSTNLNVSLYKIVKVLLEYELKNNSNDDELKKIKEEFDSITLKLFEQIL